MYFFKCSLSFLGVFHDWSLTLYGTDVAPQADEDFNFRNDVNFVDLGNEDHYDQSADNRQHEVQFPRHASLPLDSSMVLSLSGGDIGGEVEKTSNSATRYSSSFLLVNGGARRVLTGVVVIFKSLLFLHGILRF